MFNMVDEDKSGTLTFAEFKEFMLSEDRQRLFTQLMKKERSQQLKCISEAGQGKPDYLPLSADCMMRHLRYKAVRTELYTDINSRLKGVMCR